MKIGFRQLRRLMHTHLSLQELKELAFDLDVDFEDLLGSSKSLKVAELIAYLEKRNLIVPLIEALKEMRPDIKWQSDE